MAVAQTSEGLFRFGNMDAMISFRIAPYHPAQREEVLDLSLRAWDPVFRRLEPAVPAFVYNSFYPEGWRQRQYDDLATVLDTEPETCDVALHESQVVGWICTRLHPEDSMGEVYVLAVDPDWQRQEIGRALMDHALHRARSAGIRMVMVETGDDPGHAAARHSYERQGFQRWPVTRYFKDLSAVVAEQQELPRDTVRMESTEHAELFEVVRAWDKSMVANNSLAIGSFMTDDWIIIGPDGSVEGRDRFLGLIASGDLRHDTMTSEDLIIRVLGDTAVVVARGISAGTYRGSRFREQERSSNVFVRRDGRWLCTLTHLSSIQFGNRADDAR